MTDFPVSGWYMASTSSIAPQYNGTMGLMHSLAQGKSNNWNKHRIEAGVPWGLDNGVFSDKFDVSVWLKRIEGLRPYKETCLFVVIPDVIQDFAATITQFRQYRSMVSDFPVALVSQDGIYQRRNEIPWDDFDCLFVGGSDTHKLGMEGGWIIQEAKARGKWVHVGRVNSVKRILQFWQADSWDGTHLGFKPSDVKKFNAAVLQARSFKQTKGLFDDLRDNVFSSNSISELV